MTNHLNTVRNIAKYDPATDTTTVASHIVYNAFGNVSGETNPAVDSLFLFTARPFDPATGLQNNLNRWYDLLVGRWLSEDPIGFVGGDTNCVRYARNQPTIVTDANGLATWEGELSVVEYKIKHDPIKSGNQLIDKQGEAAIAAWMNRQDWPRLRTRFRYTKECPPGTFAVHPGFLIGVRKTSNVIARGSLWLFWWTNLRGAPAIHLWLFESAEEAKDAYKQVVDAPDRRPVRGPSRIRYSVAETVYRTNWRGICCPKLA